MLSVEVIFLGGGVCQWPPIAQTTLHGILTKLGKNLVGAWPLLHVFPTILINCFKFPSKIGMTVILEWPSFK